LAPAPTPRPALANAVLAMQEAQPAGQEAPHRVRHESVPHFY
jgi:hypothetical protein